MAATAIVNIGTLISGNIQEPVLDATSVLIENEKIAAVGPSDAQIKAADQVLDAVGMTLIPGLIDSHVHPAIGDYHAAAEYRRLDRALPAWRNHPSMISFGELHVPGRPHDPAGVKALAILAR